MLDRITKAKRKKHRHLQDWEIEAISQAYLDGEKLSALASEFNTLPTTISKLMRRLGYPRRGAQTTLVLQTEIARLRRELTKHTQSGLYEGKHW